MNPGFFCKLPESNTLVTERASALLLRKASHGSILVRV